MKLSITPTSEEEELPNIIFLQFSISSLFAVSSVCSNAPFKSSKNTIYELAITGEFGENCME